MGGFVPPANTVQTTNGQLLRVAQATAGDVGKALTATGPGTAGWAAGGGGLSIKGRTTFQVTGFSYNQQGAGDGTELRGNAGAVLGSSSYGDGLVYGAEPAGYTYDGSDGSIYIPRGMWVQVSLHWHLRFPSSSPTLIGASLYGLDGLAPSMAGYHPASPARAGTFEGGEAATVAHSTGDLLTPIVWANENDYLYARLWWNTDDIAVQGGLAGTPNKPTMLVTFTEFG